MKTNFLIVLLTMISIQLWGQNLKPYTVAFESTKDINTLKSDIVSALKVDGFKILGQYTPANDANRRMIAITSNDLLRAISSKGGIKGFAGALRIGITKENGKSIVSFTTPEYWMSAYFQKDYPSVKTVATSLHKKIQDALSSLGTPMDKAFGSKEGISSSDLQSYHYMFGMPYFEDNVELASHTDFQTAIDKIEANLKSNSSLKLVYKIKIPNKNIMLYGIGMSGENGESSFLSTIDKGSPKHTAFLPYEILVIDGKVFMMHGRYRIALSFPDLSMGTFMKIVSAPGNIKDAMEKASN